MKRLLLCSLAVLLVTASAAHADSISFSVGGHRVRIDAPRNCRSASCASITIPGVYESRRKRFDDDDEPVVAAPPPPPPAPSPPPQQAAPPPPAPAYVPPPQPAPQSKLVVTMVPAPIPLATFKAAATTTQEVPPPAQPKTATQPCPPADKPAEIRPAPVPPPPPVLKVLRQDDPTDSPIGDWETEKKGLVRIVECGKALCGYAIRPGDTEKGEAVLINMKPKTDAQWTGSVYSKDSGDTYYGSINLHGPSTLRVEACAIGRFYCNDNHWTRIARPEPERVMSSRDVRPRI